MTYTRTKVIWDKNRIFETIITKWLDTQKYFITESTALDRSYELIGVGNTPEESIQSFMQLIEQEENLVLKDESEDFYLEEK